MIRKLYHFLYQSLVRESNPSLRPTKPAHQTNNAYKAYFKEPFFLGEKWNSNPRPLDSQSSALTN